MAVPANLYRLHDIIFMPTYIILCHEFSNNPKWLDLIQLINKFLDSICLSLLENLDSLFKTAYIL